MPLDAQCQALVDSMVEAELLDTSSLTPALMRESIRAMAAMTEAGPEMAEITDLIAPGPSGEIPVRVFRARNDESLPLLVFLHGGGFVIGDIETHDAICRSGRYVGRRSLEGVDRRR
jgi:acetyl esterase